MFTRVRDQRKETEKNSRKCFTTFPSWRHSANDSRMRLPWKLSRGSKLKRKAAREESSPIGSWYTLSFRGHAGSLALKHFHETRTLRLRSIGSSGSQDRTICSRSVTIRFVLFFFPCPNLSLKNWEKTCR